MIPSKEEVLAQLVMLWQLRNEVEPVEPITMAGLATELMYPPLFLINALEYGKTLGILEHDYKTDKVTVLKDAPTTHMGMEVTMLMNALEDKIRYENAKEQDLTLGLIQQWCTGVRPSAAELALRRLVLDNVLYEYDLADPKDKKSVYTFYTLVENKDKNYGKKQFKPIKKENK